MVHVGEERDVNEVVTLSRTVQYTDKQEVGVVGKSLSKILLGFAGQTAVHRQ